MAKDCFEDEHDDEDEDDQMKGWKDGRMEGWKDQPHRDHRALRASFPCCP
jgi:hypothetical protein